MADGRRAFEWGQTASQMALLANINRGPRKRTPFAIWQFMPPDIAKSVRKNARRGGMTKAQLHALRPVFDKA